MLFNSCSKVTPKRIEGSWELNYGYRTFNLIGNPTEIYWEYRNNEMMILGGTSVQYIKYNYSFTKDGNYQLIKENILPDTSNIHLLYVEQGNWSTLGKDKINDFPSGSRILFSRTKVYWFNVDQLSGQVDTLNIHSYLNNSNYIYHVEKLNNRELVLKYDHEHAEPNCYICPNQYNAERLEFRKE